MLCCIQLWRWCDTLKAAATKQSWAGDNDPWASAGPKLSELVWHMQPFVFEGGRPCNLETVSRCFQMWSVAAAAQPVQHDEHSERLFLHLLEAFSQFDHFCLIPDFSEGCLFFSPACCSLDVWWQRDGQPWHSSRTAQQMSTLETLTAGLQSIYASMRQ